MEKLSYQPSLNWAKTFGPGKMAVVLINCLRSQGDIKTDSYKLSENKTSNQSSLACQNLHRKLCFSFLQLTSLLPPLVS